MGRQLWLDVERVLHLRRQSAPKGDPSTGRGSRLAVSDSRSDSSSWAGAERKRVLYHQQSAANSSHVRCYPAISLEHTRAAMSHPQYGPLRGAALTLHSTKSSPKRYMKVAEGRRTRCPIDGESCASDFQSDVECTMVRPSATGLWTASVREARPLMSDEGNAGMGCTG